MEGQPAFPFRVQLLSTKRNVVAMQWSIVGSDPVDEQAPLLREVLGSPPVFISYRSKNNAQPKHDSLPPTSSLDHTTIMSVRVRIGAPPRGVCQRANYAARVLSQGA